ncbi:MAG TPA: SDR family oxidoreductase [Candidatus Saccharimonadaceae bacterium]|nr:SDR family oxidoreductase [Candidatus Saccharimonadaceae bacterium]
MSEKTETRPAAHGGRRFAGRRALVTGATSGIGRAAARALAVEGADLVLSGRRRERLREVQAEVVELGGRAHPIEGDVREADVCAHLAEGARAALGGLDHVVHAAGVIGGGGVTDTPLEEWDRVLDSNLRSLHVLTMAVAPLLKETRGSLVTISSVASFRPYANLVAYCVSKAGVDMYVRCAALDLAPHGVRVNAVNPGVVVTELHTVSNAVPDYAAFLERSKSTHPIGRVGQPDEVAALVLYLLGDDAGWITGSTVSIDGGRGLASAR